MSVVCGSALFILTALGDDEEKEEGEEAESGLPQKKKIRKVSIHFYIMTLCFNVHSVGYSNWEESEVTGCQYIWSGVWSMYSMTHKLTLLSSANSCILNLIKT